MPLNDVLPNEIPFFTAGSKISGNYTFDASAKTLTCDEIGFKRFLYVFNSTIGELIYNPYDPDKLGTLSGFTITFDYDTSSIMQDSDDLLVLVELEGSSVAVTSFNETIAESNTSYIEGSATYGLIPDNFRKFTAKGGSTGVERRLWKVSTGTRVAGYGAIQSYRTLPHRVGKSSVTRFSGYFESNTANSWQGMGLIAVGEELSFGYDGTVFGVWHRYGGLSEVRTITVTGASGGSTDLTLTLNSVAYTIPLTSGTVEHNAYEIAAWLNNPSNQSVWEADQVDDTVIINALSDGAKSGTYSFSHATATGTIAQNTAGVKKTNNHIAQADWNGLKFTAGDFILDPSKGNLYQIQYQNMGYGDIIFSVMNPITRKYEVAHTIRWSNSSVELGIPNPSMHCGFYAASLGSITNLNVYMNSIEAAVGSNSNKTRNPRSITSNQSLTTTNETTVLALRNRRTYNGYNNQTDIEPLKVTVSNETTRSARVRIRVTTDPNVEQNFTAVGSNLVSDVDTTQNTFSGGILLDAQVLPAGGQAIFDLKSIEISQPPTMILIVTVERVGTGGSNTNFETTYTWNEDF